MRKGWGLEVATCLLVGRIVLPLQLVSDGLQLCLPAGDGVLEACLQMHAVAVRMRSGGVNVRRSLAKPHNHL